MIKSSFVLFKNLHLFKNFQFLQSGAWSCFDEFNRIEMDVLSVVAQQIQTIHSAIVSQVKTFEFEGAELTLNQSCSM